MAETITRRANEARYYSIICDEVSDASNKEQLSFCLCYVNDDGDITHCANQRLNLVFGTSYKISSVRNLMDVIKDIYFLIFLLFELTIYKTS